MEKSICIMVRQEEINTNPSGGHLDALNSDMSQVVEISIKYKKQKNNVRIILKRCSPLQTRERLKRRATQRDGMTEDI